VAYDERITTFDAPETFLIPQKRRTTGFILFKLYKKMVLDKRSGDAVATVSNKHNDTMN
jgi:hypothetical protein